MQKKKNHRNIDALKWFCLFICLFVFKNKWSKIVCNDNKRLLLKAVLPVVKYKGSCLIYYYDLDE